MPELREAASFEGLAVLAVIYFILNLLSRSGRKRGAVRTPPPAPAPETTPTQGEGFSLDTLLRQIERVKQARQGEARPLPPRRIEPKPAAPREGRMGAVARGKVEERPRALPMGRLAQAPQTERGPLGRHSATQLPSAEDIEERTSLEDQGSLEGPGRLGSTDLSRSRLRAVVDQDEAAEAVVQRRIREVEARNRPLNAADHAVFDQTIRQGDAPDAAARRYPTDQLRQAFIWREILGPPKSLE